MTTPSDELIIVRSLADSDLGLFAAHRSSARSKQRAININALIVKQLLSDRLFSLGGAEFDCNCSLCATSISAKRKLVKVHKNWRLGGKKIEGSAFAQLDSKDFVLIRSTAANDGARPLELTFVSKKVDRVVHAGIAAIVERDLVDSMAAYRSGHSSFAALAAHCGGARPQLQPLALNAPAAVLNPPISARPILPMPNDKVVLATPRRKRTIDEKLKTPHILERMLQVSSDLSAPAQLRFMQTIKELADQMRRILISTGRIVTLDRNHASLWSAVKGKAIGFVDGGLANLSMLGSAPIAARVGAYIVVPGQIDSGRESFKILKHLIDELYADSSSGVYVDSFPDIGALRDAARISIEAAGTVQLLADRPEVKWVFTHGALVNPVSRYTDVMRDGQVRHSFPHFSKVALQTLLPQSEQKRNGRDLNFISVHLRQLELMRESSAIVCGVVEREGSTATVCKTLLDSLDNDEIAPLVPLPPDEWKRWFKGVIDPADDDDFEGQRITDSLLFRCVLEPGEALQPVKVNRNEMRRAPQAWQDLIVQYPKPMITYLQQTEWGAPIRVEFFEKDLSSFRSTIELIYHCALLLPNYAFPVGLDIVDKFARIPDWLSRPVNTRTAVLALKRALDTGDSKVFNSIRYMLCGSSREWLFRPGILQ